MLLSAVFVLVVAQSSSEIPEGLMNNPVYADSAHKNMLSCQTFWSREANWLGLTSLPTESDAWDSVHEDSVAIMRRSSALLKNFSASSSSTFGRDRKKITGAVKCGDVG